MAVTDPSPPIASVRTLTTAGVVDRLTTPRALIGLFAWTAAVTALLVAYVDRPVAWYFKTAASPEVVQIFRMTTDIAKGEWPIGTSLIVLVVLAWRQRRTTVPDQWIKLASLRRKWAYLFWTAVVSGILVNLLKWPIGRLRPRYLFEDGSYGFIPFNMDFGALALPSGHTTTAIAVAVAAAIAFPRHGALLLILGLCLAISRIVVGAHYPGDIAAGFFTGGVTALLLARHVFPDAVGRSRL
ncbi:MAG: phosphatase PAP2 family protein [Alphaproteobacteria bacterium]|nr:phosphatase PAP2 family protein [Alphaproteobacteria bacterium]